MSLSENIADRREAVASRHNAWLFGLTLLAATLLYLATNEPIVAAILPCIHGGWHTFHTGLWLLRSDPCRPRARACFVFYLAAACWNVAAAALVSVGIFLNAANIMGFQQDMSEFAAMMLVLTGGVVLNTLLGLCAIRAALVRKIRVWVHPRLRATTGGDLRLIAGLSRLRAGFNRAVFVVGTALVFPMVAAGAIAAVFAGGLNRNNVETTSGIVFLVLIVGGPLAMIPCYAWLSSRIIARSPQECWPEMMDCVDNGI